MEYDHKNSIKAEAGFFAAAAGASTFSLIIDTYRFESLTWLLHAGAISGDFTAVFTESDVVTFGGEETVVPAEEVLGAISFIGATDDDTTQRVGIVGKKQFQRIELVGTNTPVGQFSCVALKAHPQVRPTPS